MNPELPQSATPSHVSKPVKIALLILAVFLIGGLSYVVWGQNKVADQDSSTKTTDSSSTKDAAEAAQLQHKVSGQSLLFATSGEIEGAENQELKTSLYTLSDGKLAQISYPLPWSIAGSDGYQGNRVQWSADGSLLAYSYGDVGGMDAATPKTFNLVLMKNGQKTFVIKNSDIWKVPFWRLLPNGSAIYYASLDAESEDKSTSAPVALYKYDVAAKSSKLVASNIRDFHKDTNGVFLGVDQEHITFLRYDQSKMYLHSLSLETGKGTDKLIYDKGATNLFSGDVTPSMLSPDEKWSAVRVQENNNWKVKIINMQSGQATELINLGAERSANNFSWSPDSKNLAFDTGVFAAGSPDGKLVEVLSIEINTEKKTVVDSIIFSTAEGYGGMIVCSWSPDGKYLAYTKSRDLTYYNTASSKATRILTLTSSPSSPLPVRWAGF